MKILLTGGLGYIGAHVCTLLQSRGYRVVIVDNLVNSSKQMLRQLLAIDSKNPPILELLDITNTKELEKLFQQHDDLSGVIHFAALKSVNQSIQKPLKYYHNNIVGLIELLKVVEARSLPLIFSSSCTVYGQSDVLPITENQPFKPSYSPYGFTKQMGEQIIKDTTSTNEQFKAMSLRYFNPIGAHDSALIGQWPINEPENLVPYITQVAIGKRKELKIFGDQYDTPDGSCIRDYIHVMDLAEAHLLGLEYLWSSKSNYYVFNVGLGEGVSVKRLVKRFEEVTKISINHRITNPREGDVPIAYAEASKIQTQLGWIPKYSIDEALLSAWKWEQYLDSSGLGIDST